MEKTERIFIKNFMETKYPQGTHLLELDICFDYYNGLCFQLLNSKSKLTQELLELEKELEDKILLFIEESKNTSDGINMEIYYLMLKIVIIILKKYYYKDGKRKY